MGKGMQRGGKVSWVISLPLAKANALWSAVCCTSESEARILIPSCSRWRSRGPGTLGMSFAGPGPKWSWRQHPLVCKITGSARMLPGSGVHSITARFVISSLFLVSLCLNSLIFKNACFCVVHRYNGIPLDHKKDWNTQTSLVAQWIRITY